MQFKKVHEVLRFIEAIKGRYSYELEDTFSNGFCYWFAKILEIRFNGTIYYNPDLIHFATLIDSQLFDINGLVHADNSWFNWDDYSLTHDVEAIYHSCILKDGY